MLGMRHLSYSGLLGVSLFLFACKKLPSADPEKDSGESRSATSFSSEAAFKPIGNRTTYDADAAPAAPLACRWIKPPTSDAPKAQLRCFVANAQGEAVAGIKDSVWSLENSVPGLTVQEEGQANGTITLNIEGSQRDDILSGIFDLQVSVRYGAAVEHKSNGRDLLRARPDTQRAAAFCGNFFTLMLSDEYAMVTHSQLPRFEGCDKLAAALQNRSFPEPSVRPAQNKSVVAVCTGNDVKISVSQDAQAPSLTHETLSAEICQDLASFVNALGL